MVVSDYSLMLDSTSTLKIISYLRIVENSSTFLFRYFVDGNVDIRNLHNKSWLVDYVM